MAFDISKLQGWAGPDEAKRAWDQIGDQFPTFQIVGSTESKAGGTYRLWDFTRKVLGGDTRNYAQKTGSCVAFGMKNAIEYLQCIEIARGEREVFKEVFTPYLYYTSRVLVGGNKLRGRAGSVGSWMAKAVEKYGTIPTETDGLPEYSGQMEDAWGDGRGDGDKYVDLGDDHLIQTTAPVRNWAELVEAIGNGYPVTIASNLGFEMKAGRDGFHRRSGSWAHQMKIPGLCDGSDPWCGLLNSWGDVHGRLKDFETGDDWPIGMLRVRPDDLEPAFRNGELFAVSQFQGFPAQRLDWGVM